MRDQSSPKADVYERVTAKILADLEKGELPWHKPWTVTGCAPALPLRANGVPYQGINVMLLWMESMEKGFKSSKWMTFKQALEVGANVRKGEKGTMVVFSDRVKRTEIGADGQDKDKFIPFLKAYSVFNLDQIDNLPEKFLPPPPAPPRTLFEVHQGAEAFFGAIGAEIRHGGDRAFYRKDLDFIQMPEVEKFVSAAAYAGVKAHEIVHWTGHERRNAREFGKRFGDNAYAFEELVAELGAAFLCAELGVAPEVREDHAAYVATWLKVLKNDKRAVIAAASHAQHAVTFLKEQVAAHQAMPMAA